MCLFSVPLRFSYGLSSVVFLMIRRPPKSTRTDTRFPYTTLFRSRLHVGPIGLGIVARDVPYRLGPLRRRLFQLVLARVGVVGQMTDVCDVANVGELVALVRQGAAERVARKSVV